LALTGSQRVLAAMVAETRQRTNGTISRFRRCVAEDSSKRWRLNMGKGALLWLIGIPLPIILVIWLFGGLN
jgi:hypothetical protein